MLTAFAAAVKALLDADANLTVFDGPAPDLTPAPYVVIYISTDSERSERMTVNTSVARLRVTTHSVADTTIGARIVADRVSAALLDVRLSLAGFKPASIRHEFGLPPAPDQSTGNVVIDAVDGWTAHLQKEA